MSRNISFLLTLLFVGVSFNFVASARAATTSDPSYGLNTTAVAAQLPTSTNPDQQLNKIVSSIIKTILGITGVIFMGLVIYAGNLWMTAGGNEEQVKKARQMIVNAVIGILAVFAAYVITSFVVNQIVGYVTATP